MYSMALTAASNKELISYNFDPRVKDLQDKRLMSSFAFDSKLSNGWGVELFKIALCRTVSIIWREPEPHKISEEIRFLRSGGAAASLRAYKACSSTRVHKASARK